MDDPRWAEVDRWLEERLGATDDVLDRVPAASAAAGLPAHDVSPLQGRMLEVLARAVGAQRVLELGTLGGYSTIFLARAAEHVVTVEADPRAASAARENLELAGVASRVTVVEGRALEVLPGLEGPFDLIFLDADKRSNPGYLGWAITLSRPGTLIVADNVVRGGAILDPPDASAAGARAFLELLGQDRRLVATAVQTVGAKGYDGFALAFVAG